MRQILSIAVLIFALALACAGQTPGPTNLYAGGISYNVGASPAIAGTGLYARLIAGAGTYAFTVVDALPITIRPFTVSTDFSTGIAQKIFTIGNVPIYVPTAVGVSYTGTNTGWAWSTGGLASIAVRGNWKILPNIRVVKSSVSGGAGYGVIVGVLAGWGE